MKIKIGQRLVSVVLAVGMMTGVLPIPAFAETENGQRPLPSMLEQENDAADGIIEIELNGGQPRWPNQLDASACEWVANKYQKPRLDLKKGKFKLTKDKLGTDVALTIGTNAELLAGTINGSVNNEGVIWEGTFEPAYHKETKSVGNSGTINGGTFKDLVANGASGPSPSPDLGYISGGTFLGQVKNYGTITGTAEIRFDAQNTENNSGYVYNYNVISGGRFSDCTIITNSSNEDPYETGSSRLTFRGISGGVFNNCTIQKGGELNNWIKGGTFVDCKITGQAITGGIYNKDPGAQREAVVQFENGTDTFSLVKNGEEVVPGVITDVTEIYAASTVRIETTSTKREEIPIDRTFVITPSVPVWNVNGDTSKHCAAGGTLELSTADAQEGKILLNVKKDFTLTVNGKSAQKAYNEDVKVTAEDKEGETFTGWTADGVEIADKSSKTLTFKMPANDVTLTANYTTNSYTLTVKNGTPESVTGEVGTGVTLTADDPGEGMTFDRWELSDDTILISGELTDQVITVRIPEGGATAEATYKKLPVVEDTYNLTAVNCKAYKADDLQTVLPKDAKLEEGTLVVVTFTDTPEDVFGKWIIESDIELEPLEETNEEGVHSIKIMMPACEVTITATTNPVVPEQPNAPGDGDDAGGAVVVIGGVVLAGAVIGTGIVAANHYITTNLPQGFDLPTTRQQLAMVLWNMAGKPEVTPAENYTDVEEVEAQKAVHWVVENQLMEPESENVFDAQRPVGKLKTLQLMIKTNKLMQTEAQ